MKVAILMILSGACVYETALAAPDPPLEPTGRNMEAARSCAAASRIPGGGYCVDWYYTCLNKTLGEGNFSRLGIPNDAGYYNQMCSLFKKSPSQMITKPK
jgi:hypothetical protein